MLSQAPTDELTLQTKELDITNVSSLPLTAVLSLEYPFQLLCPDSDSDGSLVARNEQVYLLHKWPQYSITVLF
jgi:hypothetical protein